MISKLVGWVTRREGRKFLDLGEEIDEAAITGEGMGENGETSLYIHIPFCRTLCPFCCFNRYPFKEDKARKYFQHLRRELGLYIEKGFKFTDFYFGGGTPTIMLDELVEFIDYLREKFEVKRISLETSPREINRESVDILKSAGINRLSIGVQSFDNEMLKTMGRSFCSGKEIKEKLMMAEGEFDTLNVDFVFNFPRQSIEKFKEDVATFKDLAIDQATFYPLMASPHKKNFLERKFNRIDTSREKKFYDIIMSEVYAAGYKASTAWCFSKGDRMIDEYIIDFDDYVGIGTGSVSIIKGNFYVNSFSLERYEALVNNNRLPIVGWRQLSEREHLRYYLLTKLAGMEIDKTKFYQRFNADINEKLRMELLFLKLLGLVKDEDNIKVTTQGMYPVSVMMREFFAALNGLREYYIEKQI
jgi:coproporphyrinogen III oxidase-like Fe-S oxidoreductase